MQLSDGGSKPLRDAAQRVAPGDSVAPGTTDKKTARPAAIVIFDFLRAGGDRQERPLVEFPPLKLIELSD